MDNRKPTREDLEAMRQEYALSRTRQAGGGLPFNLDDDLKQARQMGQFGLAPERWAQIRGVPVEYARALLRHIEK